MSITDNYDSFYKMANMLYRDDKIALGLLKLAKEANKRNNDALELLLIGNCFISKYDKPTLEALEVTYPIVNTVMVLELYSLLKAGLLERKEFNSFLSGLFDEEDAKVITKKLDELSNPFSDN